MLRGLYWYTMLTSRKHPIGNLDSLCTDTARNLKAEFWFFLSHWSYKGCHLSTTITSSVHIFFVFHCSLPSSCDNTQPVGHCHVARVFRICCTNRLYKQPAPVPERRRRAGYQRSSDRFSCGLDLRMGEKGTSLLIPRRGNPGMSRMGEAGVLPSQVLLNFHIFP